MNDWDTIIQPSCPYSRTRERFEIWRDENEEAFVTWFVKKAEMAARTGDRVGSRLFVEMGRQFAERAEFLSGGKQKGYKIPNNFSPYVGRELIYRVPLILVNKQIKCNETKEEKWYRKHPEVQRPMTHLILVFKKLDDDPLGGMVLA